MKWLRKIITKTPKKKTTKTNRSWLVEVIIDGGLFTSLFDMVLKFYNYF